MQEFFPAIWEGTFDAVARQPAPVTLKELMEREALRLDASTVHRQLAAMVKAGLLERVGRHKDARYWPREMLKVSWVARLGQHWQRLEWTAAPPIDWRFPLTSRVPDIMGRVVLLRLMERLAQHHLLSWKDFVEAHPQPDWPQALRRELADLLQAKRLDLMPTIIVYGSCARGDARQESDVDVLVIGPNIPPALENLEYGRRSFALPQVAWEESLRAMSADINLGASRPLDVLAIKEEDAVALPKSLQEAIARDGITVYGNPAGASGSYFSETWSRHLASQGVVS